MYKCKRQHLRAVPITAPVLIALAMSLALGISACKKGEHHHHDTLSGTKASAGSLYDLPLQFTDAKGRKSWFSSLQGSPIVLSMIYTRCQSICPTLAGNMIAIQKALAEKDRARTKFVLVSFDSGDSPADLASFSGKLRMDEHWTLFRGEPDEVRQFAAAIGFQYRRNPDGIFAHSATTYLLNAKGETVFRMDGTVGAPAEFAKKIADL